MRKYVEFEPKVLFFREKLIAYMQQFKYSLTLETHGDQFYTPEHFVNSSYQLIVGYDSVREFGNYSKDFFNMVNGINDWVLGGFSYDFKNNIEYLTSCNNDGVQMPEVFFFQPRFVLLKQNSLWKVGYNSEYNTLKDALELISDIELFEIKKQLGDKAIPIKHRTGREHYLNTVQSLKDHIHRGDIYEINYCVEFYSDNVNIDPVSLYFDLIQKSPVPFAAFMKNDDKYLMSASPERYLKKLGGAVMSQPIKGTAGRGNDEDEDRRVAKFLCSNAKERSENIMITDLVRNDLSKIAKQGSVIVEELCGIYNFRQVHQMISTISAKIDEGKEWFDIILSSFPMGSMTGAPKMKAMQLIENYEDMKRGFYSGTVGYLTPEKDFDFNVIIRSVLYNSKLKYLSFMVGSAITSMSDPEYEYDECLLKARAIMEVFEELNAKR
ncbi:MAG: anthranilate synthase component I family protein [Marinilabiliaceae bacterium]|nr:anthranilate synthase component I family protein [Marinilabiliaceae bacterium]